MTELEEASTARLAMKKWDARRRVQDEADIALGGIDRGGCLQMKLMHLDNGSVRGSRKPLRFRKRGPIGSNCHS